MPKRTCVKQLRQCQGEPHLSSRTNHIALSNSRAKWLARWADWRSSVRLLNFASGATLQMTAAVSARRYRDSVLFNIFDLPNGTKSLWANTPVRARDCRNARSPAERRSIFLVTEDSGSVSQFPVSLCAHAKRRISTPDLRRQWGFWNLAQTPLGDWEIEWIEVSK